MPHVTFSDMLLDSSCARELIIVMSSSPLLSRVWIFSFSKNTPIPFSFSLRTVVRVSTVFRAKRETDFVIMRSIFPAKASAIMLLKPSRFFVLVAEIPSSVYTPTNSHSGLAWIYFV